MSDLFDRYLIAGIVFAVGGLMLLRKRKQSRDGSMPVCEDESVVSDGHHYEQLAVDIDDRPDADITPFPTGIVRRFYDKPSYMRSKAGAQVVDFSEVEAKRLQQVRTQEEEKQQEVR